MSETNTERNGANDATMSLSEHHARCIEALQRIALIGDTGSNQYREYFDGTIMADVGWRVADTMREVANSVVGDLPLSPIFQDNQGDTRNYTKDAT